MFQDINASLVTPLSGLTPCPMTLHLSNWRSRLNQSLRRIVKNIQCLSQGKHGNRRHTLYFRVHLDYLTDAGSTRVNEDNFGPSHEHTARGEETT